jgi:crotonobetainyl-CoA:carnitine CoA-transferase CaiB-like acyl-CoA transferase
MSAPELLAQLHRLGGLPREALDAVRVAGADPVLRTVYSVAESGAASIAAAGMASAWLWRQATGESQHVDVDVTAAAAAMQSFKFMAIDGQPPGPVMDDMTDFYRTRDGRWLYLHCNFPNLAAKNCSVLGAQGSGPSLRAQIAQWDGQALEDAIAAAGGCGALVRTEEEWRKHPQGIAACAAQPLEILRIGDAPPEPLPARERPLAGVRVLDLTRVLAGPTCAKTLAEHGADVLKVSCPGLPDSGVLDWDTGLGKLSASLDLRDDAQRQALCALVEQADVFSQAYRPGALEEHGLGPQDLARMRPGIVAVTLNAWGFEGPWRERRGYDTVVQAANGMALSTGLDRPACLPVSVQDYVAGYLMAYGAMVALSRRVTEGGSWLVRVSLAACGEWVRSAPRTDAARAAALPTQVPDALVRPWLVQSASPVGRLTHLGSVTRMSRTPTHWARPLVALGASPAWWPESTTPRRT